MILIALIVLVVLALYCIGTVGIIWLLCELLNLTFSVPMAIGVWFVTNLVIGLIQRGKKKRDCE